jgi:hypothetical protein
MLMYPLQEAVDLLTSKLNAAKKSMDETVEDLEFLREQSTVMEVNFARVHNVRGAGPLFLPSRPFASCATYSAVTVYMRSHRTGGCGVLVLPLFTLLLAQLCTLLAATAVAATYGPLIFLSSSSGLYSRGRSPHDR